MSGHLRLKAQPPRAGGMSKDIFPFPLLGFPTAAEISLSLEAGRAQLGQAEEPEATLDEIHSRSWLGSMGILGHLNF